jgi:NADPH:quinone reductase-like Zn-dependent oxidoreductase
LGQAALNIAVHAGAQVTATTRNAERIGKLRQLGAARVEIEGPERFGPRSDLTGFDAVWELVGNSTVLDSLAMVHRGGRVLPRGFPWPPGPQRLLQPVNADAERRPFPFLRQFRARRSGIPLSDIPSQAIVDRVAAGSYQAKPARVFHFDQVPEAHRVMESNQANGKLVVRM